MKRPMLGVALTVLFQFGCTGRSPMAPTSPTPPSAAASAAAIFLTPNSWDMPIGGGSLPITIVTAANAAGSAPALHVDVALSSSSGSLSNQTVQTDGTGHATVTWTGTAGATITARAGDVSASSVIRISVPTPVPPPSPRPTPLPDPPPNGHLWVDITPSTRTPAQGAPVSFTATVRGVDGVPPPTGLSYHWDFGDGTTSTAPAPSHAFGRPVDHWTVQLYVTTADGRDGLGVIAIVVGAG